jgi:hypothetical protein
MTLDRLTLDRENNSPAAALLHACIDCKNRDASVPFGTSPAVDHWTWTALYAL